MAPSVIDTHEEREESFLKSQPKQAIHSVPIQNVKYERINSDYIITEEPIRYRRPLRVVCLGAGYSGLMMGIVHNERMKQKNIDFTIYERNKDLGGTWLENREVDL